MPDDFSSYGTYDELAELNRQQLKDLIDGITAQDNAPGSDAARIAALYNVVMDTERRDSEGLTPIKPYMERINAVSDREELLNVMLELDPYGVTGYFDVGIGPDLKDSRNNIVGLSQGGLTLGDKEYYTDRDRQTQNIRKAFEEAEAEGAILFLDEIDGLVQSRERAARSWEVTQVNELLHRMENFNGVMIGATNFPANLDAAILRRFTFKLEFDYLDETGKKLFFERMFHTTLTPEEARELADIPMLAPGDFRTARPSFFYLGAQANNRAYLDALARESEVKSGNRFARKPRIGF